MSKEYQNKETTTMTATKAESYTTLQHIEFILNIIGQMIIGFITIYMSWFCFNLGLVSTVLHAWLVTLGFALLMAEGIMCHYNGNAFTIGCKRGTKTTAHSILMALGGFLGCAGVLVECIPKDFVLASTHSKLGFSAFILCLFSMLSGLSALLASPIKRLLSPLLNKTVHNFLGLTTFVIAMAAQIYGYKSNLFKYNVDSGVLIMMVVLQVIVIFIVCIGPLKAMYQKISCLCSS